MEFKGDELKAVQLGIQILSDQPWMAWTAWPTHGMPSSNGVGNAPLFSWIVAGAWAVVPDPVAVTRLIALINVACLYPLFRWCRRHMSAEAALLVLAVLAVNPFSVMFSRKIWGQDLLCIGVVLVIWAIEWLRSVRPWRGVVLMLLAIVFLGQMHQSGPIALAVLPVALAAQVLIERWTQSAPARGPGHSAAAKGWARPSKFETAALLGGGALVLLFWLPYLAYLSDVPLETLAERPVSGRRLELLRLVANQVRPADILWFFEPDRADFFADSVRRWSFQLSVWLGTPLLVVGVWGWLRRPHALPVVGFWWLAIIAVFSLARIKSYPFYVLVLAPLPALLSGGAFDGAMPRVLTKILTVTRVAYVVALAVLTIGLQNWLFSRGGTHQDAYGVAYSMRVVQAEAVARGIAGTQVSSVDPRSSAGLDCRELPDELIWLAERVDRGAPEAVARRPQFICDGFTGPAGRQRYEWLLR
jgi:hypothetical protein